MVNPMIIAVGSKLMGVPAINTLRAATKKTWSRKFRSLFGVGVETADLLWRCLQAFVKVNTISLEDRWIDWSVKTPSIYVDGVDFLVQEDRPLNKALYSHKFKHAGYREYLFPVLPSNEKAGGDKGYRGSNRMVVPLSGQGDTTKLHNKNLNFMKAGHETVNKRIKDFRIMRDMFRLNRVHHEEVFICVANIVNKN
ncbi:hypothetical protein BC829DRAFT_424088 [Chytridium lagenaria]|nr:hypothetical protein BC829DRAFT_424088 [Chytridium lagenaria]